MKKLSLYILPLLFIPFLHTIGQVTIGDDTPTDPSSMLEVKSTNKGMLVPRMTEAQRNGISSPADGLILYQTDGNSGFYYHDSTGWSRMGKHSGHYVGEFFGGGCIFHVDEKGEHGLIVGAQDLSDAQPWSNVTQLAIGGPARSAWNGPGNTLAIMVQPGHMTSAAKLCDDWSNPNHGTGVFGDWYLMSTFEARILMNNIYHVQKTFDIDGNPATEPISDGYYWTSKENDAYSAWGYNMTDNGNPGDQDSICIKSAPLPVRAIRAF